MNFNKVIICGRATKDIEIRNTAEGKAVANLSVATNNVYVDKSGQRVENTDFHNIVLWGAVAENAAKYCKKGTVILVEGRLQNRSWLAQDGTKKYATEVVAERFQLGPKPAGTSRPTAAPQEQVPEEPRDEEDIRVENIPF